MEQISDEKKICQKSYDVTYRQKQRTQMTEKIMEIALL